MSGGRVPSNEYPSQLRAAEASKKTNVRRKKQHQVCTILRARPGIANEKRIRYIRWKMMRSCRVTVQDVEGFTHTVEVTAESLYEAVALGLAALRGREWVAGITHGTVKVSVADVRVEHEVKMTEFAKWIDRPGGSPADLRRSAASYSCRTWGKVLDRQDGD